MNRLFALAGALALGVIVTGANVKAEDDKIPDISEIMQKTHGKEGLRGSVTKAVKASEWDDAAKEVKDWLKLGDALAKNKPEKGETASWKKLTTSYNKTLKSLSTAVEKKDAKGANTALRSVGGSCKTCHAAHRS